MNTLGAITGAKLAQPENQLLSARNPSKKTDFTDQSEAISKAMEQVVDSQS